MKIYTFFRTINNTFGNYPENKPQIIDNKIVFFFEIRKFSSECLIFQKILS